MALTPSLADLGKVSGEWIEAILAKQRESDQPLTDALALEASAKAELDPHSVSFFILSLNLSHHTLFNIPWTVFLSQIFTYISLGCALSLT